MSIAGGLRSKYFIEELKSFSLGNPDIAERWKKAIFELENEGYNVVAFALPVKFSNELKLEIERMIKNKVE